MTSKKTRTPRFLFARVFFVALIGFFLSAVPTNAIPKFNASLDRNTASVGETVTLSLIFEGGAPVALPAFPSIPNLNIQHAGESSQTIIVNGQASSSITHTYLLTPLAPGEFAIPALKVEIAGTRLTSPPLKLKAGAQPTDNSSGENREAFLKLVVPKKEMYIGEVLPLEVHLYVQNARNLSLPQIASDGLMIGNMPNNPAQSRTRINGIEYNLVIFRVPLSATKTGTFTLGPATCGLVLLSGNRDFFGNYSQARPVTLVSPTNTVQVLPLPQKNKPLNFNGAVGNFTLSLEASPTTVSVGDPITLKIHIRGRGALDRILLPEQPAWREFKMYTPSSTVEAADPLGLEGIKNFELVVSPENSDIKELPPFSFSFFNPEKKEYHTATHAAIPLRVRASAATPQPTVISAAQNTSETPSPTKEIVHIKPLLGKVSTHRPPLILQTQVLFLSSLAPLFWIASIVMRKQKEKLANNPKLRRQREVERTVQNGLQELRRSAAENKSEEFFATVFRLLQEQIGERLDLPASAITESVLEEQLKARGLDPVVLSSLHELFQNCNQARYAQHRTAQELQTIVSKVETAINELRKIK